MKKLFLVTGLLAVLLLSATLVAAAFSADTRVNVGSPPTPFSQNKQNEPALAVDANHPNVLVSGSNDEIDMEACNAGTDNTCPFTPGVGVSGVYFSFDSGTSWVQPTYAGWTARDCLGVPGNADHILDEVQAIILEFPTLGSHEIIERPIPAAVIDDRELVGRIDHLN